MSKDSKLYNKLAKKIEIPKLKHNTSLRLIKILKNENKTKYQSEDITQNFNNNYNDLLKSLTFYKNKSSQSNSKNTTNTSILDNSKSYIEPIDEYTQLNLK